MRRAPLAPLVLLAVATMLATACTRRGIHTLPPPPSLPNTTTTAPPADLSAVQLAAVPGQTTTTIEMGPGAASLTGTVSGPEGPVAGAVVRAERLVGDGRAHIDVLSADDGTWGIPFLKGGRYRVRAWREPDLALTSPQVFFLSGSEAKTLNLSVDQFTGLRVTSDIAPNPPVVGERANLVVQVTQETVDPEGVVRAQVVPGISVELYGSANWRVATDNPTTSDGAGNAHWQVRCEQTGTQPLSVLVGDIQTFPIGVPDCAPRPTTTTSSTTTTSPTSTSTSSSTTSTTARRTTTTEDD